MQNILVNYDETTGQITDLCLSDFGAICYKETQTKDKDKDQLIGTIEYMAPEFFDSKQKTYDERVDAWALGVILYMLLTIEFPFYDEDDNKLACKIKY